jgi:hypothetical protein
MSEESQVGVQEVSLSASGLVLRGSLLTKLAQKGRAEIVHNLAEFDEIILETRREYHGKYLVVLALICGGFIIWKRFFPVWVCAPFFLFAALIIFAWFRVGIQYLILRRAGETVEYPLRDTPAFVTDFFEQMSANVRSANANVRLYLHRRDAEVAENEYKRTDSRDYRRCD